jgi:Fe-S cluster biosynthesis and repair protein YggX
MGEQVHKNRSNGLQGLALGAIVRIGTPNQKRVSQSRQNWRIVFRSQGTSMARTVNCIKLGKQAEGLDFAPYPGELGKRIYENVSKEAWAAWLKHQTMLLNENRLNLADLRARQYLARQMEKHFFGEGADAAAGFVPPTT